MAVPLIYNSCLSDEALEAAVEDYRQVKEAQEEQAKQKADWQDGYDQRKAAAAADNQPFDEEEKVWDVLETAPFQTQEEKYVVCLDTMGQDR